MRKPLRRAEIEALTTLLYDDNTEGPLDGLEWTKYPGLFVRRTRNTASWVFRWNVAGGKKKVMGLGSREKVAPQEAVDLAERYMEIARSGGDPRAVRDAEREAAGLKPVRSTAVVAEAAPSARTFRDAARLYLAEFEDRWKDKNHAMQWAQTLRDYVYPVIGDVPLGEIGVGHIVQVLEPLWHPKHVTAKKVRSRIRLILDWAEAMEWRSGDNPTRSKAVDIRLGNGMSHTVKHFEAIPYRQMPSFWEALAVNVTVKGDVTRFMILTAVRANEALGATWEEIDLEQRVWTIPAARMKMERGHRVPLSDQAMAVLEKRRARAGHVPTGLVFPSSKGGQLHRSVPKAVIQKLRGTTETAHGCRSTFVEWCDEEAHVNETVREKCLAHKVKDATVAAYARTDMMGRREPVMQAWADYVTGRAS
jgi:integrase